MPDVIQDTLSGVIKLKNLPERECFTTLQEFLERLPEILDVVVPQSVSGVIVSRSQPDEDSRDKLWVRRDGSGNFLGIYVFGDGRWHLYYDVAPGEIKWIVGDSDNPPEGFVTVDSDDPLIPSDVVAMLKSQYIPKSLGEGFVYYAVRFDGF